QPPKLQGRLLRWIFFNIFTHPQRLRWALLPARLMQKAGLYRLLQQTGIFKLLPISFRKMEQMLPPRGPLWPRPLPEILRAKVTYGQDAEPGRANAAAPRRRIGFFAGCIG